MLLHVSTFKMSSSGSPLCLAKITYRFSGLSKIKLLKYKMMMWPFLPGVDTGQERPHHQQRCIYSHYANLLLRCTINILLKFLILYFNNFILLRPENLYVNLARHIELPEDDILNVETCRSMLFVIIVVWYNCAIVGQNVNNCLWKVDYHIWNSHCEVKSEQIFSLRLLQLRNLLSPYRFLNENWTQNFGFREWTALFNLKLCLKFFCFGILK